MRPSPTLPALALLAALLAGCGDAVTSDHRGDALATLRGQMSAAPGVQLDGREVRLALAWYPGIAVARRPAAIVPEELAFQGTFPLDYTFDVYAPPPAAALFPLEAPFTGRGAFGVLLAYTDGNGNGRLDLIGADTPLAERDHVVAASAQVGFTADGLFVLYTDSAQPSDTGLAPGLNLVRQSPNGALTPRPLSTPVPLALEDRPTLDLAICEEAWNGMAEGGAPPCGISLDEAVDLLFLDGTVRLVGARLQVDLGLTRNADDAPEPAARVELNGEPVPYDALLQRYALTRDGWAPADGRVLLRVSLEGGGTRSLLGTLPAAPAVLTPTAGASVPATQPLEVTWGPLAGAQSVQVRFDRLTPAPLLRELMTYSEAPLPTRWSSDSAPGFTGPARVSVTAQAVLDGDMNHAFMTLDRVTQVDFTLAP